MNEDILQLCDLARSILAASDEVPEALILFQQLCYYLFIFNFF